MDYKLTPEIIAELKEAYPGVSIFKKIPFPSKIEFALRPLYPQDHEALVELARNLPVEQASDQLYEKYIWENCVLWPHLGEDELNSLPVGIPKEIEYAVSYMSGYVSVTPKNEVIAEPKTFMAISVPEIWEAPTGDVVKELKEKWKFCYLFKLKVGPYHFIIRPLLQNDLDYNFDINDNISVADKGILWPEDFNMALIPMGTIVSIAATIKNISGETYELDIEEL